MSENISRDDLLKTYAQVHGDGETVKSIHEDTINRYEMYKKFIELGKPNLAFATLHKTSDLKALKTIMEDDMIDSGGGHIPGMTEEQAGRE